MLCFYTLGKAAAAVLDLCVLAWVSGPPTHGGSSKLVSSRARLHSPRSCPFIASGLVLGCARAQAQTLALVHLGLATAIAGVLAIPLSVTVAVLVFVTLMLLTDRLSAPLSFGGAATPTWSGLLGETAFVTAFFLCCVILAHAALGGQWPRERSKTVYSKLRFVWQGLSLRSLHHWLLMNKSVARNLAEKASMQETVEAPTEPAEYFTLTGGPQYQGYRQASALPQPMARRQTRGLSVARPPPVSREPSLNRGCAKAASEPSSSQKPPEFSPRMRQVSTVI